jgi:hypothetical protein
MCLEHHAELDTKSRQSKGLSLHEVRIYQAELYDNFINWACPTTTGELLRNLVSSIGNEYDVSANVNVISAIIILSTKKPS